MIHIVACLYGDTWGRPLQVMRQIPGMESSAAGEMPGWPHMRGTSNRVRREQSEEEDKGQVHSEQLAVTENAIIVK